MKYSLYFIMTLAAIQTFNSHATMIQGQIAEEIIEGFMITWTTENWAMEAQSYTNGGTTFTYPEDFFTATPRPFVTITSGSHAANQFYVAEVTANSTTSATVKVYFYDNGTVSEASTGSVAVSLVAYGD